MPNTSRAFCPILWLVHHSFKSYSLFNFTENPRGLYIVLWKPNHQSLLKSKFYDAAASFRVFNSRSCSKIYSGEITLPYKPLLIMTTLWLADLVTLTYSLQYNLLNEQLPNIDTTINNNACRIKENLATLNSDNLGYMSISLTFPYLLCR